MQQPDQTTSNARDDAEVVEDYRLATRHADSVMTTFDYIKGVLMIVLFV